MLHQSQDILMIAIYNRVLWIDLNEILHAKIFLAFYRHLKL